MWDNSLVCYHSMTRSTASPALHLISLSWNETIGTKARDKHLPFTCSARLLTFHEPGNSNWAYDEQTQEQNYPSQNMPCKIVSITCWHWKVSTKPKNKNVSYCSLLIDICSGVVWVVSARSKASNMHPLTRRLLALPEALSLVLLWWIINGSASSLFTALASE